MNTKTIILATSALALLAGCSKSEVLPVESAPQEITFQTVETKAASGFSQSNAFYSYAFFLTKANAGWDSNSSNSQAYISNSKITFNTTEKAWKNESTKYYWPKEGSLTFFAWSDNTSAPAVSDATIGCANNTGITVTDYDITSNQNKDLLVADIAKDKQKNEAHGFDADPGKDWKEGVPTIFKHVLSNVVFTVNTDYATENDLYTGVTFKLKSIKFKNVSTKGSYKQGSPSAEATPWTVTAATSGSTLNAYTGAEITVTNGTATAQAVTPTSSDYSIVLPQTFSDDTPEIEIIYTITTNYTGTAVTEEITATKALKDIYKDTTTSTTSGWTPGKQYTLNILLGLNEILWDPDVKDWDTVSNSINI
jgi:hypothetical protein